MPGISYLTPARTAGVGARRPTAGIAFGSPRPTNAGATNLAQGLKPDSGEGQPGFSAVGKPTNVFCRRGLQSFQYLEVITNVQEYQNPFQFRSAGHCRRGSCRVAAVREKNQRLQQTVEGKRSLVHGRGRGHSRDLGSSSWRARTECTVEKS